MSSDHFDRVKRRLRRRFEMQFGPGAKAEQERVWIESQKYLNQPIEKWPPFKVQWTLSREEQHFTFDGYDAESFLEEYPDGLTIIPAVHIRILDYCLHYMSLQTPVEFWEVGCPSNKARVIAHFVNGKALTPPLIGVHSNDQLLVGGGNQRLAVARAKKELSVPVLVKPYELTEVKRILELGSEKLGPSR